MKLATNYIVLTVLVASLTASQGAPLEDPPCGRFACLAWYRPVCGSDGKTYPSECEMGWQQCQDPGLTIVHEGECGSQEKATRKRSTCGACKCHPNNSGPLVCGSDGTTYRNSCELHCKRFCERGLREVPCGKTTSLPAKGRDP